MLRELLLGLDYLHSGRCSGKPTIHRDLKAANVYELTPFSSSFFFVSKLMTALQAARICTARVAYSLYTFSSSSRVCVGIPPSPGW